MFELVEALCFKIAFLLLCQMRGVGSTAFAGTKVLSFVCKDVSSFTTEQTPLKGLLSHGVAAFNVMATSSAAEPMWVVPECKV